MKPKLDLGDKHNGGQTKNFPINGVHRIAEWAILDVRLSPPLRTLWRIRDLRRAQIILLTSPRPLF
jgi:hypothetical protein